MVAPLYFRNQIGFGVINQSSSAFNHILTDVSLVVYQACSLAQLLRLHSMFFASLQILVACIAVYHLLHDFCQCRRFCGVPDNSQNCLCMRCKFPICDLCLPSNSKLRPQFESIAGFSAVIDRLGEFSEVVSSYSPPAPAAPADASETLASTAASPTLALDPAGSMVAGSADAAGKAAGAELGAGGILLVDVPLNGVPRGPRAPLLELSGVSLRTPGGGRTLVDNLDLKVRSTHV